MPSPFPGMDPYLEKPQLWPDVHAELISSCRALLNRSLKPKYVARIEDHVYVENDDDEARRMLYVPDVRVTNRTRNPSVASTPPLAIAEPIDVEFPGDLELRESRIEIRTADANAVVAVIEILSPGNKLKGADARDSFLKKRREVMASSAHWVEIDLLRDGVTLPFRSAIRTPHEYIAFVSHAKSRPKGKPWLVRLQDRLPAIGIPLLDTTPTRRSIFKPPWTWPTTGPATT